MKQNDTYIKKLLKDCVKTQKTVKKTLKQLNNKSPQYEYFEKLKRKLEFRLFVLNIARYAEKNNLIGTVSLNLYIKIQVMRAQKRLKERCFYSCLYIERKKHNHYDIVLMYYIKKCISFLYYNNHAQLFLDLTPAVAIENNEGGPMQYVFVPKWINYINCFAALNKKPAWYDPFHIYTKEQKTILKNNYIIQYNK